MIVIDTTYPFISAITSMSTVNKELNFQGTQEELFHQFFCVNAYNRQFYPQFKRFNNCLYIRTLMLGFEEEAIPFEVSTTFFLENGKNFEMMDNVYPITRSKESFLDTSMALPLKKLIDYYDANTRERKNQPKIDFILKIISPKFDEIAKDQNVESGIPLNIPPLKYRKITTGGKNPNSMYDIYFGNFLFLKTVI